METATLDERTAQDVVRFIDDWLDENSWKIDTMTVDFALDVRQLVAEMNR